LEETLSGDLRELKLLEALEAEPEARQADLARRLGLAVGTVNWLLKRLAAKGYIKIQRIGRWHWRYLLTPRGVREKSRLLAQYVRDSLALYRQTREEAQRLLGQIRDAGYSRVRLEGEGELLDIVRLTALEQGVEPVVGGAGAAMASTASPGEGGPGGLLPEGDGLPVIRVEGYRLSLTLPEHPGQSLLLSELPEQPHSLPRQSLSLPEQPLPAPSAEEKVP